MVKKITNSLLAMLLFFQISTFANAEIYKRVKIYTNAKGFEILANKGLSVDHCIVKNGTYIIAELSTSEIQIIKDLNFVYEILIGDLANYYAHQNDGIDIKGIVHSSNIVVNNCNGNGDFTTPQNFSLGNMGGYFTYQQMLDNLDSMASKFPNLISLKHPIDTFHTIQGRDIFVVKISDNPNVSEAETKILYDAIHHAREPASMSEVIYYMWYLLENYAANSEIQYLVNNLEMYFVPCVNPDGYIYNQTNSPNGGGMWRKNRRLNIDGTYGVDLNRNYGYMWGGSGASPQTSSDTYRGAGSFSEPEIMAMKWLCESTHFSMALNAHSFGNDLIYPWGHNTDSLTPDSTTFKKFGKAMTTQNSYFAGLGVETVGYYVNGDSDDWMYGEQNSKPKIYSMTPEVGASTGSSAGGFWPPATSIVGICKNTTSMNLMGAKLLLAHVEVKDISPLGINTNPYFQKYSLERLGLDGTATYTVSITPLLNVASVGNSNSHSNLPQFVLLADSILITLNSSIQMGDNFSFVLNVSNGFYTNSDTITKTFGAVGNAFFTDCTNQNQWNVASTWGLTTASYHSAPSSITDSPNGLYANVSTTSITTAQPINLLSASASTLNFWARWATEIAYDYAQVSASIDSGITWTPLCGNYTKLGNVNQDLNMPLYDGTQTAWVEETINLNSFIGHTILLQFKLVTDNGTVADGFYFDDVEVKSYGDSTVGIIKLEANDFVSVAPNPAKDYVGISYPKNTSQITIYNCLGNQIYTNTKLQLSNLHVDTKSFAQGIYFVKVRLENGQEINKKVIITD